MSDEDIQCPEHTCPLTFNTRVEVLAHLQWDHNRTELEADAMIDDTPEAGD